MDRPQTGSTRHLHVPLLLLLLLLLLLDHLTLTRAAERMRRKGFKNRKPTITKLTLTPAVAKLGETLVLTCQANSGAGRDSPAMIYWLANNQFIEDAYVDGRVAEKEQRSWTRKERLMVRKSLKFTRMIPEDFGVNFTCIVMTPKGTSWKNITLGSSES